MCNNFFYILIVCYNKIKKLSSFNSYFHVLSNIDIDLIPLKST